MTNELWSTCNLDSFEWTLDSPEVQMNLNAPRKQPAFKYQFQTQCHSTKYFEVLHSCFLVLIHSTCTNFNWSW